jgi:hypothetical protein
MAGLADAFRMMTPGRSAVPVGGAWNEQGGFYHPDDVMRGLQVLRTLPLIQSEDGRQYLPWSPWYSILQQQAR